MVLEAAFQLLGNLAGLSDRVPLHPLTLWV